MKIDGLILPRGLGLCRRVALSLVMALCAPLAIAMTLEVRGNMAFATGYLNDDLLKFESALADPHIDTVVFVNAPGGDLWTGLRIGSLIAEKGLKTVVAGHCISSCSLMFAGGRERRFSDAFAPSFTYIGIHGAHQTSNKQVDPQKQPKIYAFFKDRLGQRFNADVINMALYEMDDAGSLLRVFDPVRSAGIPPYHCKSGNLPRNRCTTLSGVDAISLGLVTHKDLVKLDLPPSMRPSEKLMGQPMSEGINDLPGYLNNLSQRICSSPACTEKILQFAQNPSQRVLAVPVQGQGYGLSVKRETPMQALASAIYACNHARPQGARLCEAQLVNDADVHDLYRTAETMHQDARAQLHSPPEKFYADENYGGDFVRAKELRAEQYRDITPASLDGVDTVGTQALATALLSTEPPVLIDVQTSSDMIPGARRLLYGGNARTDANADAAIEKRFGALLQLFAPDKAVPLVFYCQGRNSWLSVNAALRARKLGYTRIGWYRGGLESWKAARLPLGPAIIRAVVN